jgi:hypothetical protein
MKNAFAALCAASVSCGMALAGEAGPVEGVSLTVYNDNLSLIREQRTFELSQGRQALVLTNVSGQLQPQTVHLTLPNGPDVRLLEQNFDYDLVDQSKLLSKFIGQEIMLVDDARNAVITGRLLSVSGGIIIESDGKIMLNPPGRVVLPGNAAEGLLLAPTLSWLVDSPSATRARAEISYLSGGLGWQADYVLMLDASDRKADLEGWVTLSNNSGTSYKDAHLKLVAGEVNRVREQLNRDMAYEMAPAPQMAKAAGGFAEEQMFEYHLYDLDRQTTIANAQQKQIGLLNASAFPVTKKFLFDGANGGDVRVSVEFNNDEKSGLGMPLPAGTMRAFKQDIKGDAQFIGESRIAHTPRKEDVRLYVGNAFDIKGETTHVDHKDLVKGYSDTYKVVLKNRKLDGGVVVVVEHNIWGDWTVKESSLPYKKRDANTIQFDVPVEADSEVTLTYNYEVHWK